MQSRADNGQPSNSALTAAHVAGPRCQFRLMHHVRQKEQHVLACRSEPSKVCPEQAGACPGPWYVTSPPRSDVCTSAPCSRSCSGAVWKSLLLPRFPSVYTGACCTPRSSVLSSKKGALWQGHRGRKVLGCCCISQALVLPGILHGRQARPAQSDKRMQTQEKLRLPGGAAECLEWLAPCTALPAAAAGAAPLHRAPESFQSHRCTALCPPLQQVSCTAAICGTCAAHQPNVGIQLSCLASGASNGHLGLEPHVT